jgi:hypothetical protein
VSADTRADTGTAHDPRQPHASYPRECVRAHARTRELQRFDPTCQSNPLTDTIIRFSRSGVRHRRAA